MSWTNVHNPSIQCSVCGRWMRLHARDRDGLSYQRFYGSYETLDGQHQEHDGDVCVPCESRLPNWKPYLHPMLREEE